MSPERIAEIHGIIEKPDGYSHSWVNACGDALIDAMAEIDPSRKHCKKCGAHWSSEDAHCCPMTEEYVK